MPAPPARADLFPAGTLAPATAKTKMAEFFDYVLALLGATGTAADARTALAVLGTAGGTLTGLLTQAAGANIASAATVDLTAATGNCARITGTTGTSAFTMTAGQQMWLIADGAWPLTYHATTNKINGGASHTCAAGDLVHVFKDLSAIIQTTVLKANGTPVGLLAASQSEQEAAASTSVYVSPGRQQMHPSSAKAWVLFNGTGTPAIVGSYNCASITDHGVGDWSVNYSNGFSSANYAAVVTGPGGSACGTSSRSTGSVRIDGRNVSNTPTDYSTMDVACFGDQ